MSDYEVLSILHDTLSQNHTALSTALRALHNSNVSSEIEWSIRLQQETTLSLLISVRSLMMELVS